MFTGTPSHAGALVTAILGLTGAAIVWGGAATADPNQDQQFLALLDQQQIPALTNVPSLIATAHTICRELDGGMPVDGVVDLMRHNAFKADSTAGQYPQARLTTTMNRFIAAAVGAYCPSNQSKIESIAPAPGPNEPAAYTHNAVNSISDPREHATVLASLGAAVPAGEIANPPEIPAPPPPNAQFLIPPRPISAPPPVKKPAPPLQQPPPPQQQPEPPAVAPLPGDATGGGGIGGGSGGGGGGAGGPTEPAPKPHLPPGTVRLAP